MIADLLNHLRRATGAVLFAGVFAVVQVAVPVVADPVLCRDAARRAAAQIGVPVNVLQAIALAETGRRGSDGFAPWPWTVNMEGTGKWFDSQGAALEYARRHLARGAQSFDLGCFQINYRWHGAAFASLEQMIDPDTSGLYAARFLRDLYDEMGDWSRAAGAYHSRNRTFADRYRSRFDRILAALGAPPADTAPGRAAPPGATPVQPPRVNTYPLLRTADASPLLGSLVPLSDTTPRAMVALR